MLPMLPLSVANTEWCELLCAMVRWPQLHCELGMKICHSKHLDPVSEFLPHFRHFGPSATLKQTRWLRVLSTIHSSMERKDESGVWSDEKVVSVASRVKRISLATRLVLLSQGQGFVCTSDKTTNWQTSCLVVCKSRKRLPTFTTFGIPSLDVFLKSKKDPNGWESQT